MVLLKPLTLPLFNRVSRMVDIKKSLDIINFDNLQNDELFLLDIPYEMFENDIIKLFKKNNHLVFWCDFYDIFDKCRMQTQEEFPLMALPWFIDTIEEQYWNYKPNKVRKPGDISESITIDGETIGISPMIHCCAENLPGYSFWNKNRKSHLSGITPQDTHIPKYMLKEWLLDDLKRISTELGLKSYT